MVQDFGGRPPRRSRRKPDSKPLPVPPPLSPEAQRRRDALAAEQRRQQEAAPRLEGPPDARQRLETAVARQGLMGVFQSLEPGEPESKPDSRPESYTYLVSYMPEGGGGDTACESRLADITNIRVMSDGSLLALRDGRANLPAGLFAPGRWYAAVRLEPEETKAV
jgi:hypothetical protein